MATLTVQTIVRAGLTPSLAAAAAGGDAFPNNGKTFLRVVNANVGAARTVTIASQLPAGGIPQGAAKADIAIAVPASGERWIGPFDAGSFNDTNGRVVMTYSSEADVTVGVYSL